MIRKNEKYTVTAEGYTYEGLAVARIDNMVVFIPGLIRNEEAEIGITAVKKNYAYGRLIRILKPSVHHTDPPCSVYRLCGGCTLQHMDEEEQRFFKEDKVRTVFRKNASMEIETLPIIRTKEQYSYRNKVQIPVQVKDGKVQMGFYQNHSNRVIPFENCLVQSDLSNQIAQFFRDRLQKYEIGENFRHLLIKHAHRSGEVMVVMIVRHFPFAHINELQEDILSSFPAVRSLSVIENTEETNVILKGREILLAGRPFIRETLLGCSFRISARSFYQVNPYATEKLYQTAIAYAQLTGKETLIDLYCGTGTMGIIASRQAKQVYGIEIVTDAVKDAEKNAEDNDVHNISFLNMDAGQGASYLLEKGIRADAMIVDPPRRGCSSETLDAVLKIAPERLVYVSCEPSTLARDVKILHENGYDLKKVQPVDMFPQTVSVETVCQLVRRAGE